MQLSPKRNLKPYIIAACCFMLISLGAIGIYVMTHSSETMSETNKEVKPLNTQNLETPTDEQVRAGNEAKLKTIENDKAGNQNDDITSSLPVTVAATVSNRTLYIRSSIDALRITGTCDLSLIRDTSKLNKSVPVQALAQSTTCQGFDIPLSELSSGEWTISLTVTSGDETGSATTKVTI